jgi:transcriptional regulator with XRE-family HTH domain
MGARKNPVPITVSAQVGRYLRKRRLLKGYKIERISEALGMSTAGYSRFELGHQKYTLEDVQLIAEFLGMTLIGVLKMAEKEPDVDPRPKRTRADAGRKKDLIDRDKAVEVDKHCHQCNRKVFDTGMLSRYWCRHCDLHVHKTGYETPARKAKRRERAAKKQTNTKQSEL